MTKCLSFVFAALVSLLAATPSQGAGFVFRNGSYWRGGIAHYRTVTVVNGCPAYTYTPVVVSSSSKVVNNYAANPPRNWEVVILDVLKARENKQAYLQALGAIGYQVRPAYGFPGYGGSYQLSQQGVNASSIYALNGYNAAAIFGAPLDVNLMGQQAARLAEQSNDYAGAHTARYQSTVNTVALITAESQAFANKMAVLKEAAYKQTTTSSTSTPVLPGVSLPQSQLPQYSQTPVPPMPRADDPQQGAGEHSEALKAVVGNRCLSCHSGTMKKGNFDLTKQSLTDEEWGKAVDKVQKGLMPVDKDGKPTPLSAEEKALFRK